MKRKTITGILTIIGILFFAVIPFAYSESIPFDSDRWEFHAKEKKVENYLGQKSLYLGKGGMALIKDSQFTNGIIECDVAFPQKRGFAGVVWRLQDGANYEKFYMRPHQSGNPDANQYTPVFNHSSAWQLYYGKEYSAPVKYRFDQWNHVRIVVSGKQAEIYINDMEAPAFTVNELKREVKAGKVGIWGQAGIPGLAGNHFANFSYTSIDNPTLKGVFEKIKTEAPGTIMSWDVSDGFPGDKLKNKLTLSKEDLARINWHRFDSEQSGLANLARVQDPKKGNTVFVRVEINSDKAQVKPLQFGFSDSVNVYFNGQLIYGGNDLFRSRDYRFLGTIGYYDTLYLPLLNGKNELIMAVSEKFGGWGVQARFVDMTGISLRKF